MNHVSSELQFLKREGVYRNLGSLQGIDFCTNDYLGLAKNNKFSFDINFMMSGSASSRLIPGYHEILFAAENSLAEIFKVESVLFFGSGYMANMGVIQALSHEDCEIFSDELNHASIIDGVRLSKGKKCIFPHNNLNTLEENLKESHAKRKIVVTESIFSMDGDSPDLHALVKICENYNAFLIIDEAHSTGVMGEHGYGMMEDISYNKEKTVVIHTCSKALGCYGAFVTSGAEIRELLINKARTLIFSTALPPVIVKQVCIAMENVMKSHEKRLRIAENVKYAKEQFRNHGIDLYGSHVAYFKVQNVIQLEKKLKSHGIYAKAIRFPSVAQKEERIRVTIKEFNSKLDILKLVYSVKEIIR